ncbi:LOW QUALITY PROTEIN: putative olfactory receptor 2W6 [Erethizon dorsatum]
METSNGSLGTDFILPGFSNQPQLENIISGFVFIFYIIILVGNTTIIVIAYLDAHLHTPMYFFPSNLSFLDPCYTTSIVPQMLVNIWGPKRSITYGGCVLQFFFALDLGATECLLLAVMAFDRSAAVCQPLCYTVIMHPQLCQKMVLSAWLGGLGGALIVCSLTLKLPRCGRWKVDHFFCEMPALIKMACVSKVIECVVFALGVLFLLAPLSLIFISYGVITRAVMKIKSAGRWRKVLNTCGSHLTVVTLFYGTIIYMYMKPQNTTSQEKGKFSTLFYTIVTPSLNPLIYTLRNKDVKAAIKRILCLKKRFSKSYFPLPTVLTRAALLAGSSLRRQHEAPRGHQGAPHGARVGRERTRPGVKAAGHEDAGRQGPPAAVGRHWAGQPLRRTQCPGREHAPANWRSRCPAPPRLQSAALPRLRPNRTLPDLSAGAGVSSFADRVVSASAWHRLPWTIRSPGPWAAAPLLSVLPLGPSYALPVT